MYYHKKVNNDDYEIVQRANPNDVLHIFGMPKNKVLKSLWKIRNKKGIKKIL